MGNKRNILLLIPNLDFGGAQRSFQSLANALSEFHTVYVCVFNTFNGVAYSFEPEIIDLKIPGGKSPISKIRHFFKRLTAVSRLKRRLKIEVTISYLEGANYINVLTGSGNKVILSVRGSILYDENISGLLGLIRVKLLMPCFYRFADHIVALNHGIRYELVSKMKVADPGSVSVIRNFYPVTQIQNLAQRPLNTIHSALSRVDYIIYAGRLSKEKGIISIIDVFDVLLKNSPDLRLVLVGDGPMREKLVSYASTRQLSVYDDTYPVRDEQVLFLGYQENPYNLLANASMLLLASTAEGGPNVLREAMICGTPVVSTNCPYGPAELLIPTDHWNESSSSIEGKYGLLLPMVQSIKYQQVIDTWAAAIQNFINDSSKTEKVKQAARSWARQQSNESILAEWQKIIDQEY